MSNEKPLYRKNHRTVHDEVYTEKEGRTQNPSEWSQRKKYLLHDTCARMRRPCSIDEDIVKANGSKIRSFANEIDIPPLWRVGVAFAGVAYDVSRSGIMSTKVHVKPDRRETEENNFPLDEHNVCLSAGKHVAGKW